MTILLQDIQFPSSHEHSPNPREKSTSQTRRKRSSVRRRQDPPRAKFRACPIPPKTSGPRSGQRTHHTIIIIIIMTLASDQGGFYFPPAKTQPVRSGGRAPLRSRCLLLPKPLLHASQFPFSSLNPSLPPALCTSYLARTFQFVSSWAPSPHALKNFPLLSSIVR